MTGVIIDIPFAHAPADTLGYSALHLAFYDSRMNGLAHILDGGIAEETHLPGTWVDFNVDDVCAKRPTRAV